MTEDMCIHSRVCRFRFVGDPDCDGKASPNSERCESFLSQTDEEGTNIIRELRNALIVSANNAHERKMIVNEVKPERMFYNEGQFQSLVEYALNKSKQFSPEYESKTPLLWDKEG